MNKQLTVSVIANIKLFLIWTILLIVCGILALAIGLEHKSTHTRTKRMIKNTLFFVKTCNNWGMYNASPHC